MSSAVVGLELALIAILQALLTAILLRRNSFQDIYEAVLKSQTESFEMYGIKEFFHDQEQDPDGIRLKQVSKLGGIAAGVSSLCISLVIVGSGGFFLGGASISDNEPWWALGTFIAGGLAAVLLIVLYRRAFKEFSDQVIGSEPAGRGSSILRAFIAWGTPVPYITFVVIAGVFSAIVGALI